jgi:hypothetical protein
MPWPRAEKHYRGGEAVRLASKEAATELQASGPVHEDRVPVLVGWLVTFGKGNEARLGPDKTRAENYAAHSHGTIEPMYVWRPAPGPV